MKKCLLMIMLMWFLTDGDMLAKDTFDPSRTNIRSKTCDLKGWLKKDTLQSDRINLYDKYGNKKGWLEKDTLNPDACGGVGYVVDYIDKLFPRLFNIFEIADVDTPSCRPVSANVTPYSVTN